MASRRETQTRPVGPSITIHFHNGPAKSNVLALEADSCSPHKELLDKRR